MRPGRFRLKPISRNRRGAFMALCIGAAVPVTGANATASAAEPSGRFSRYTPLTLDELYADRMRFDRGEPRISVGIMDGQSSIDVLGGGPLRLMFEEDRLPKVIYGTDGFKLKLLEGRPAKIRYWVIVHTRRAVEGSFPKAEPARWKERGLKVHVFEVGTLLAVRGSVLDTRQWQVGVGGFARRAMAHQLMTKLAAQNSDSELFLHEELLERPGGTIGVLDARGRVRHRAQDVVYVGTIEGEQIRVGGVEFGAGYRWHGRETRSYRGALYVAIDRRGRLALINSVGAEVVLGGLVPAEIFASAHLEALKAQAVTARGEIFTKLAHRHFGDPYHLCSQQHCQVYSGAQQEQPATNKAVRQTRGLLAVRPRRAQTEVLELVDARYSANCGGHSEANEVVWGTAPSSSLRPRLDAAPTDPALSPFTNGLNDSNIRAFLDAYPPASCARASFAKAGQFRWKRTFTSTEAQALVSGLGVGKLTNVDILGRGHGGRVTGLRIKGTRGAVDVLRELPVRRLFRNLKSGLFVLDVARDANGIMRKLTFTGGGWGHGVGMCQMGAIARAEHGHTFREILAHYYSGAVVVPVY